MTTVVLNSSDSAALNKAALETGFADAGAGGTVTVSTQGTYPILDVEMPADRTLDGAGSRFMSPVLAANDGTPMIRALGADARITNSTFDGRRDDQPEDGFSDSVDGGGGAGDPRGRAYRCAIRADSLSGTAGQAAPHDLTVDNCTFQRLYGAGIIARGGTRAVIDSNVSLETNFEMAHVSMGNGATTIINNRLWHVGTGHESVNSDGFIVGSVVGLTFKNNSATYVERALLKASAIDAVISGNRVVHNNARWRGTPGLIGSYPAIQIEDCENTEVTGNYFEDIGSGVSVSSASATGITIDNNTITGTQGITNPDGVAIQSGAAYVTVSNNLITDCGRYGVTASGPVAGLTIHRNRLRGDPATLTGGVGVWTVAANANFAGLTVTENDMSGFSGLGGLGCLGLYYTGAGSYSDVTIDRNKVDATADTVNGRGIFWHGKPNYITGSVSYNRVIGRLSIATNTGLVKLTNTEIAI